MYNTHTKGGKNTFFPASLSWHHRQNTQYHALICPTVQRTRDSSNRKPAALTFSQETYGLIHSYTRE